MMSAMPEHTSTRSEIPPTIEAVFVCKECDAEATAVRTIYDDDKVVDYMIEPCGHHAQLIHWPRPFPSRETRDQLATASNLTPDDI